MPSLTTKADREQERYQRAWRLFLKARGVNEDAMPADERRRLEASFRLHGRGHEIVAEMTRTAKRGDVDEDDQEYDDPPDAADELGGDDADDAAFEKWLDEFGNAASFGSTDRHLLHEHYRQAVAPDRPPG